MRLGEAQGEVFCFWRDQFLMTENDSITTSTLANEHEKVMGPDLQQYQVPKNQ